MEPTVHLPARRRDVVITVAQAVPSVFVRRGRRRPDGWVRFAASRPGGPSQRDAGAFAAVRSCGCGRRREADARALLHEPRAGIARDELGTGEGLRRDRARRPLLHPQPGGSAEDRRADLAPRDRRRRRRSADLAHVRAAPRAPSGHAPAYPRLRSQLPRLLPAPARERRRRVAADRLHPVALRRRRGGGLDRGAGERSPRRRGRA